MYKFPWFFIQILIHSCRCIERCHGGPCPSICRQACPQPRDLCSHPCALPCHSGSPCAGQAPCSKPMEIFCQCSRRKQMTTCAEFRRTWVKHQMSALAANKEQVTVDPTKINVKVSVSKMKSIKLYYITLYGKKILKKLTI